jgi:protein subunit release factor B
MIERPLFIDIGYIIGGDEGYFLVEKLLGMFCAWAQRQGLVDDIFDRAPALGGGLKSAKIGIYCVDCGRFPALHQGVHTLIRIPPDSYEKRRHMSSAGVRISDFADLPLPENMADWGDERRRYVCDPDRAIIDTRLGRL